MYTSTVVFGVSTHSVPTVDHFFRVEWTAAFPLWTLNLAQRDTVHGARCVVLHGARIYSCTIYRGFPRVGRPLRMILHADLQIPEHARIVHASKLKMTVTGNLLLGCRPRHKIAAHSRISRGLFYFLLVLHCWACLLMGHIKK